uniref:Small EDRK-rich factor 2 n=1 Tax=Sus scrofa TaxID=9823 RepID=A0A8D1ET58_PIG
MTRGNQQEFTHQKNMKKQTNLVKGKHQDDRLSAAARKQRDSEITQQKQEKETPKVSRMKEVIKIREEINKTEIKKQEKNQ